MTSKDNIKTHLLIGPDIKDYIDDARETFLSNNVNLEIYGEGKNKIDCTNINIQPYSNVIINAHGGNQDGKAITDLCKETYDTETSLKLISKNNPQNFELFSCYSGAAINVNLILSKSSTLMTSTSELRTEFRDLNKYNILTLSKVKTENPFIKFVNYIYLTVDQVKFAIQTDMGLKNYRTDFNKLTNYSTDEIRKWHKVQLVNFIKWTKGLQESVTDLRRSNEIKEFLEEFADYKKAALELSKEYSIETYKNHLLFKVVLSYAEDDVDLVQKVIEAGADLNIKDNSGYTALMHAVVEGKVEIVSAFIEAGADLNIKNNYGYTALVLAALKGYNKVLGKLIEAGADLNIKDNSGHTALINAVVEGKVEIVSAFIEAGADLNIKNNSENTALMYGVVQGQVEIVSALIEAGADLNIKNNSGYAALMNAVVQGEVKIVSALIEAGADLNIKNNSGYTALMNAVVQGKVEIVSALIEAGADLNIKNNSGHTALMNAVVQGKVEIVSAFIEAGADLGIKVSLFDSILEIAVMNHKFGTVKTILSYGYNDIKINTLYYFSYDKEIKNEIVKFSDNPVKYILETNNFAKKAEQALSRISLDKTEKNFNNKIFSLIQSLMSESFKVYFDYFAKVEIKKSFAEQAFDILPEFAKKTFSYYKPESISDKIHRAEECLAAQDHDIELDLYSLCGENGSWYQAAEL